MTLRVGLRRVEVLVVGFSKVLLRSLGFWLEMLETKPRITGNSKSSTRTEHTGAGCLHMFLKKLDISSSNQVQGRKWRFWVFHRTLAAEVGGSWLGPLV